MNPEILIPVLGCGLFLALILAFFLWFFFAMWRDGPEGERRQERLRNSLILKRFAKSVSIMGKGQFFPRSFGGWFWKK